MNQKDITLLLKERIDLIEGIEKIIIRTISNKIPDKLQIIMKNGQEFIIIIKEIII